MTDKQIKIAVLAYLSISLVIFTGVLTKTIPLLCLPAINICSAIVLLVPWLQRYRRYPHGAERREIIWICAETLCSIISLYAVATRCPQGWVLTSQWIIAGLHFIAALLFLIFILLFKIKKLF